MPSRFNRRHGFGIGLACIALTSGNFALAWLGHWFSALLLYGAGGLAFVVLLSHWSARSGERASTLAPTWLAPSRPEAKRIAALFRPHAR